MARLKIVTEETTISKWAGYILARQIPEERNYTQY